MQNQRKLTKNINNFIHLQRSDLILSSNQAQNLSKLAYIRVERSKGLALQYINQKFV